MTWIVAAVTVGSAIYRGVRAEGTDTSEMREAAADVKESRIASAGERRGLGLSAATSAWDYAQAQSKVGRQEIRFGADIGLRKSQAFGESAYAQSGLATSGTIKQQVKQRTQDIWSKYKTDMQKQVDARAYAEKQKNIRMGEARYQHDQDIISAEQEFQGSMAEADATPDDFWEGAFG